jgi:hypothetical protein
VISDNLMKLIEKQAALVGGLSLQTIQMMIKLWSPFRDWTDHDLVISQAARSATTIESATKAARQRQRAYMRFVYKELKLPMPSPEVIDDTGLSIVLDGGVDVYMRNGVTPLDVYARPAEEYRYFQSTGLSERESLAKAIDRVSVIADTDLSLARRDENMRILHNTPGITGYRRIIHPELSQDKTSCGLCVVASQRVYHTSKLMPIHDLCNCDVMPIIGDNDPGNEINQDDLNKIYLAAGDNEEMINTADALLKTRVSFLEHGELGPIIAGGNRKGSKQRKRAKDTTPMTPAESIEKQLHVLRGSSARLAARPDLNQDLALSLQWQRDRILILEKRLNAIRRQQ